MKYKYLAIILIILPSHFIYGQSENYWETKSPMSINRAFHSTAVSNGKIFVFGGATGEPNEFRGTSSVEMYDPQLDQWFPKADMPVINILSYAVPINDKIFVIGGEEGESFKSISSLFVYDCINNQWSKKSSMNIPRSFHSAVILNNKIYAIGGRESNKEINSKPKDSLAVYTIEEYDITADKWIIKTILPFKHFSIGAAVIKNKIYILSDTTNNSMRDQSAILEEYDPETNAFVLKANLKPSKCDVAMTVYKDKIYVFGGWYNEALSTVEEYDPSTNKWTEKPRMPYVVQNHQAAIIDDKIYITGGINYFDDGRSEKKAGLIIFNPNQVVNEIKKTSLEKDFSFAQNYPNPFNSETLIHYQLPVDSNIELKVYDILGNEIETLRSGKKDAGKYEIKFNGRNLSRGIYLYTIKSDYFRSTRKMILMR